MTRPLPFKYLIPVMAVYLTVTFLGMMHHELWYDEVQHWLIARDSHTFLEMFSKKTYDDHVGLWKATLYFINHFISSNPVAIQIYHLIIVNLAVFVFLRFAPFNLLAKVLILFGYYFIFEYSILCRNYALGILLLFIILSLLSNPAKNLLTIGILFILLSNTHEFFLFATVSIYFYLFRENLINKKLDSRFYIFSLLTFIGCCIAVFQIVIESQYNTVFHQSKGNWLTAHNISFAIHGIDKGFIPFPPLHDPYFWNRHIFENWNSLIKAPLSMFFLAFPIWILWQSTKALQFYVCNAVFLLFFLTMSQMAGSRYYGMFFIYFIIAIWLAHYDNGNLLYISKVENKSIISRLTIGLFYLILFTQVLAGAYAYEQDYKRPFSQAKNTIEYIRETHLDHLPIVVDGYNSGPALSAYCGKMLYYLDIDSTCSSFLERNENYSHYRKSLSEEFEFSNYLTKLKHFILITNRLDCDSQMSVIQAIQYVKMKEFRGAIIVSENYCVYQVNKN